MGTELTSAMIQKNYGAELAHLVLPSGDDLMLSSLFPKITRALRRRLSNSAGAVDGRPAPALPTKASSPLATGSPPALAKVPSFAKAGGLAERLGFGGFESCSLSSGMPPLFHPQAAASQAKLPAAAPPPGAADVAPEAAPKAELQELEALPLPPHEAACRAWLPPMHTATDFEWSRTDSNRA